MSEKYPIKCLTQTVRLLACHWSVCDLCIPQCINKKMSALLFQWSLNLCVIFRCHCQAAIKEHWVSVHVTRIPLFLTPGTTTQPYAMLQSHPLASWCRHGRDYRVCLWLRQWSIWLHHWRQTRRLRSSLRLGQSRRWGYLEVLLIIHYTNIISLTYLKAVCWLITAQLILQYAFVFKCFVLGVKLIVNLTKLHITISSTSQPCLLAIFTATSHTRTRATFCCCIGFQSTLR